MNITLSSLDRELKHQFLLKKYGDAGISLRKADRLAQMLGGRMTIEWEPLC
ncbi:hypothetical protein [Roseomonas sp. WA12]